jgi:TorA maturation chaperone TorD
MTRADFAAWLRFAGSAFLRPDAPRLRSQLDPLRETEWREEAELLLGYLGGDPLDLQRDYVRVFLSPTGAHLSLWQSAQDDPPKLMGPAHDSALAWYVQSGIEPRTSGEPADHIGLLVGFASLLVENNAPDVSRFREQHLSWIPEFCQKISVIAAHPFLVHLAGVTARMVEQDRFYTLLEKSDCE